MIESFHLHADGAAGGKTFQYSQMILAALLAFAGAKPLVVEYPTAYAAYTSYSAPVAYSAYSAAYTAPVAYSAYTYASPYSYYLR
ncbi:hypothetical protein EVAR_28330_1 [Eumeta japonica]|uniref:Uncharacterized protein n=1 Tax=Eumeta variegata TaxID=151549 RepID=A0A4C1V8D7_EUMVA|nr:hypothetical protein EVAR_28330_1 [Eumeta japonica]